MLLSPIGGYPKGIKEFKVLDKPDVHDRDQNLLHPDLHYIDELNVNFPKLQVKGTWERIKGNWHSKEQPKISDKFSSWIWKSCLYIFGSMEKDKKIRGFWYTLLSITIKKIINFCDQRYLDLLNIKSWKCLPQIPARFLSSVYSFQNAE